MKFNKAMLPIACSTVADEVMPFWVKVNSSTTAKPHVVARLKSLQQEHIQVSKHKSRRSDTQVGLESDFTLRMNKLFDIAHADWEWRTKIQEDQLFIMNQRGPKQMSMTKEDIKYRHAAA